MEAEVGRGVRKHMRSQVCERKQGECERGLRLRLLLCALRVALAVWIIRESGISRRRERAPALAVSVYITRIS